MLNGRSSFFAHSPFRLTHKTGLQQAIRGGSYTVISLWRSLDSDDRVAIVSLLVLVVGAIVGTLLYHS